MKCPRCQQEMALEQVSGHHYCPHCGYRGEKDTRQPPDPLFFNEVKAPPIPIEVPGGLPTSRLPTVTDYEAVRMRSRLADAMDALARHDRARARRALLHALEISDAYADGWLQLAALAENAGEQRQYLLNALAAEPTNPLAIRALYSLDHRHEADDVGRGIPGLEPGQMTGERLVCPQCGGHLTYDVQTKEVLCRFCGYRVLDADDLPRQDHRSMVMVDTLKRKGQAAKWDIGGRWLRCKECGGITTLSRHTMTGTCRFCGSRYVLQENVNISFEQPDVIVPFTLDESQAYEAIKRKLHSGIRAITRYFTDAITRIDLQGLYLPCWVFDADMNVHWSWSNAPDHGDYPILLNTIIFPAISHMPRKPLEKLEPFTLQGGVDYDPRLLARYPAGLYDITAVRASVDIRSRLVRDAERRARVSLSIRKPAGYGADDDAGTLRLNASTRFLTYQLILLPVWMAHLTEEGGDSRHALVNGQSGEVVFYRASQTTRNSSGRHPR